MRLYPALCSQMGSWRYYVTKMNARELADNVQLASKIYDDPAFDFDPDIQRTLDEEIQRVLRKSRVREEIAEYLKRQPDRFFSSIVVAALEGNPLFYPVDITADPQFAIFRDNQELNEAFGVLVFNKDVKYYALDGQHRLAAIKTLLDPDDSLSDGAPAGFEDDEFSVIVIVPNQEDANETFMQKYRRLFSNLNRYAKPTDQATNIIMEEDDTAAILTRRLITENDFFKSPHRRERKSSRIKTTSKNLTVNDSYFTSLETLYEMNIALLSSVRREPKGWGPIRGEGEDWKTFKRFRPSEEYIDGLYAELVMYWEALLAEIPDLHKEPIQMRVHELKEATDEDKTDHLLFWPIGQQMLAEIVRVLLDKHLSDIENPTPDTVREALSGLGQLEWGLHQAPWQYFLLVYPENKWAMRSETRKEAIRCGRRIQQWVIGLDELDESNVEKLKTLWGDMLIPSQEQKVRDKMWQQVEDMKFAISG